MPAGGHGADEVAIVVCCAGERPFVPFAAASVLHRRSGSARHRYTHLTPDSAMSDQPAGPPTHPPARPLTPPTRRPDGTSGPGNNVSPWPLVLAIVGVVVPPMGLVGGGLGVRQTMRATTSRDRGMGIGAIVVGFVGTLISSAMYLWFGFMISAALSGAQVGIESARSARAMGELNLLSGLLARAEATSDESSVHPLSIMLSSDQGEVQSIQRILVRLIQDAEVEEDQLVLRGVSLIGVGRTPESTEALREALEAQLAEDADRGWTRFSIFGLVHPDLDPGEPGMIRMWYVRRGGTRVTVLLTGGEVRSLDTIEWEELQADNARLRAEHGLSPLPALPMDPARFQPD